ncbi:hypothetical protein LMANV2_370043 [Leptospira interrogans serovar Manilae]|uniref:Uncharacterized protein n=1 Tax=Leptospira interrogans serovar Manilae TaxID=214675 RepID=A0AAQ1P1E4_LEPIR|nr:hypothetical protein LMANV2_370043 [Leptospira interrogans serovar Manilae]
MTTQRLALEVTQQNVPKLKSHSLLALDGFCPITLRPIGSRVLSFF